MNALENYIKNSIFVTESDLGQIIQCFNNRTIEKGEYFTRSGRVCPVLGFIETGYIRVFLEVGDREVTQWVSSPGYFITDLTSFVSESPARWNMQALTDCSIQQITRKQYNDLGKQVPVWQDLDRSFIVKCFTLMEERIFNHLYMSSEERFERLMKIQPELFNIVPLHYLASMMGMTPETLSRLRKKQLP